MVEESGIKTYALFGASKPNIMLYNRICNTIIINCGVIYKELYIVRKHEAFHCFGGCAGTPNMESQPIIYYYFYMHVYFGV